MGNLKHHQFLATNSHDLKRRLDGFVERLMWCGQRSKAEALKTLLDLFQKVSSEEGFDRDNCDNVLALLSFLAASPQKSSYNSLPDKIIDLLKPKQVETETWNTILADEPFEGPHWQKTSNFLSDGDDDDDFLDENNDDETKEAEEILQWHPELHLERYAREAKHEADSWMKELDRIQYWRRSRSYFPPTETTYRQDMSASLIPSIQKFLYDKTKLPGDHPTAQHYLHEAELVREILFLYSGDPHSALFELGTDSYKIKKSFKLLHATEPDVLKLVSPLLKYAFKLNIILECCRTWMKSSESATIQLFASCLYHSFFVERIFAMVSSMEEKWASIYISQDVDYIMDKDHPTLLVFSKLWQPATSLIDRVFTLIQRISSDLRPNHLLDLLLAELDTLQMISNLDSFQIFHQVFESTVSNFFTELLDFINGHVSPNFEFFFPLSNVVDFRTFDGKFATKWPTWAQPYSRQVERIGKTVSLNHSVSERKTCDTLKFDFQIPVLDTLKSHLQTILNSDTELNVMKKLFSQWQAFHDSLRYMFLMEDGEKMGEFSRVLFDAILEGDMWHDEFFLTSLLSMSFDFPEAYKLHVSIRRDPKSTFSFQSIRDLERIQIAVRPTHPLDKIVNENVLGIYQRLFTFLLQLRMASHALNSSMKFRESNSVDGIRLASQFRLLRVRLIHFVNAIKNYIMTTVLHAEKDNFLKKSACCSNPTDLVELHDSYVTVIRDRSILNDKAAPIMNAVISVLDVCLTTYLAFRSWNNSNDDIVFEGVLIAAKDQFKAYHDFIQSALETLVRGSLVQKGVSHLEALAFLLQ